MSYKQFYEGGWQSGETGGTPITPEALNHMEQGIQNSAPTGYGLGATSVSIDSVLSIAGNGWWITNGDTPDGNWWICHSLYTNSGDRIEVIAYSVSGNRRARRSKNTTWGDWEWIDPPMMPGVEYATTERYNGKKVYRKRVVAEYTSDIGDSSGSGYAAAITVSHNVSFDELVKINGIVHCADGKVKPCQITSVSNGSAGAVSITITNEVWSAPTVSVEMAYTKA